MTTSTSKLLTSTTLPLSVLRIDDKTNVRSIGRGASPDFIASIKAIGIRQPLIVRKNGVGYVVVDGGKRLAGAQALAKSGDLAADAPIPVIVTSDTDAQAREISLALNVIRTPMHPVDEYRAFAALHTDKEQPLDEQAIADRFGMNLKEARQILSLGGLHDKILDAYRDGEIKPDAVKAFTLIASKKAQGALFDKLSKRGGIDKWSVHQALKIGHDNPARALGIVGIEEYEKRGGKVTRDLFGADHIVSDAALLSVMVQEKIEQTAKMLTEAGWSWVMTEKPDHYHTYGTIYKSAPNGTQQKIAKLRDQLDEIEDDESPEAAALEDQIEAIEQKAQAVRFPPADRKRAGCFVGLNYRGTAIEIDYGKTKPAAEVTREKKKAVKAAGGKVKPSLKLSQAISDRLRQMRHVAIKSALVAHPHADAFGGMLAGIVASQINVKTLSEWHVAPEEVRKSLDTIENKIAPKVMNAALRKAFNAKDYFGSINKALCLAAITEAVNADEARKIAGRPKKDVAVFALANVTPTGWLPKQLRTAHYDGCKKRAVIVSKEKPKAKVETKSKTKTVKAKSVKPAARVRKAVKSKTRGRKSK
jgi:ParB family chromosome partitioning protein